jgi:hypothetical protein
MQKNNCRQIINDVETRFKTVMIGSIARVENYFGYLWGHPEKDNITDKQKEFKQLWEELRTEMLNHGNFHIRKGLEDLEESLAREQDRYEYTFYVKDNNRRN